MASQPGQPAAGGGNNKPQKVNWVKIVVWLLVIGTIVVLMLWAFGVFDEEIHYWSFDELTKATAAGGITDWKTDADMHQIYVKDGAGWHTVIADYSTIDNLLDMQAGTATITDPSNVPAWMLTLTGKGKGDFGNVYSQGSMVHSSGGSFWLSLLLSLLPMFLLLGVMVWMGKKQGSGMGEVFSGGKNQARRVTSNKKFTDVAGQEEVKEEVSEIVDFLKKPAKYKAAGARVPKGILLGGPPGTGKTLMAKAIAGEAGVPFFFISASNFIEMFAGLGAKRVREMFKEARKAAPAILFIDELDAVGRKRGSSMSGNDEREQTLNQILVEMDGMDENSGLLVVAATNRVDVLDPALVRPGRFDRTVTVGLPDIKERQAILELHAKGKRISEDVDFANIAKRTPRYSGAELESVVNEAALLSVRENTGVITISQIDEAIDRVQAGPSKKHRVITAKEQKMVAIHEAGHAVIGLKVNGADYVQKITIIPRGDAGGYTLMTPREEKYNYSKSELEAKIISYMGGRAAEQAIYGEGEVSTGASNDIQMATGYARAMVTQYGMSELGPIAYERDLGSQYLGGGERSKEYSDALAARIDEAIRSIVLSAESKAKEVVKNNLVLLNLIADELINKETIVVEEIEYINTNLKPLPKKEKVEVKIEEKKSLDDLIKEVEEEKIVSADVKKPARKPRVKKEVTAEVKVAETSEKDAKPEEVKSETQAEVKKEDVEDKPE